MSEPNPGSTQDRVSASNPEEGEGEADYLLASHLQVEDVDILEQCDADESAPPPDPDFVRRLRLGLVQRASAHPSQE